MLDPTKLIPEEMVPLEPIGKMVLDRNPDNFFAETEQVAFRPAQRRAGHRLQRTIRCCRAGCSRTSTRSSSASAARTSTRSRSTAPQVPDAQLPARRRSCSMDVPEGPRRLRAEQPRRRTGRARMPRAGFTTLRSTTMRPATRCASARRPSPITTARRGCSCAR